MPKTQKIRGSPRERGAITPVLVACLALALGLMALTIDLGQLWVGENELQKIADAAALAGAKKLIQAQDPNNPGLAAVYCSEAITAAQAVASENRAFGAAMTVSGADVILGEWDLTAGAFTRTGCSSDPMKVTAIQVTVRRDGTNNPKLSTFFKGLLGVPQVATSATAVAYLGLAGTSSPSLPFAVPINFLGGQAPYVCTCRYYSYPDERACCNTCYVEMEVPLKDNFVTTDQSSTPSLVQRDYHDMNPVAHKVGNFASVPFLVKYPSIHPRTSGNRGSGT